MRSLQVRVVLVGVVGVVVMGALTALLALPLVRSVARDESRDQLVRAVDTLAARPQATRRLLRAEQSVAGPDARAFRVVRTGQQPPSDVSAVLDAEALATVRAGRPWSGTGSVDGSDVLVEARPSRAGLVVVGLQPVEGLDAIDAAFVRRLVIALAIGTAVSLLLALLVARRVVRPVRATAGVAHRLAAGERGVEPPPTGVAEVAEVGEALAHLDTALTRSESRQREFLLSISHELRTPLTSLRGYAEALRDGTVGPGELPAVGSVLVDQTGRLERFVSDLLSLARLEADDFVIRPEAVDVSTVAREAADAWSAVARRGQVELCARVDGDVPAARTDPQRLRQLLDGLLENALRVVPAGGHVEVVVSSGASGDPGAPAVVLAVHDDGPGLREGEHERAFDRGFLRDRYASQRPVGSGLGLSIARSLADRLGASLRARPGPGGGTVMELALWTTSGTTR